MLGSLSDRGSAWSCGCNVPCTGLEMTPLNCRFALAADRYEAVMDANLEAFPTILFWTCGVSIVDLPRRVELTSGTCKHDRLLDNL
jgi:hypothetical protein